ncbi:MAG: ChaN family lipoprotein [Candidatus Longimicrobiales bacterium M2_2A_002]
MTPTTRIPIALAAAVALAAVLGLALAAPPAAAQGGPLPAGADTAYVAGEYRVFTGAGAPTTLEAVVDATGRHDVVFIGEAHDDPTGHALETELLGRAVERYAAGAVDPRGRDDAGRTVALSLEFFERDVQLVVDEYLAGLITESAFTDASRPWSRYATDYRPLIEYAKEHGIDVIAANAPRRYVTMVTRGGREALDALSPEALAYLPPLPYGRPSAEYRDQWIETIARVMEQEGTKCGVPVADSLAVAPPGAHGAMGNQLQGQALWDAAMAYSIAQYLEAHPDALVLHMVGGFHVARGTGTPEHLAGYRPDADAMIVMLRPVDDVDTFVPAPAGQWGDFVIQTDASRTLEAIECRAFLAERASR